VAKGKERKGVPPASRKELPGHAIPRWTHRGPLSFPPPVPRPLHPPGRHPRYLGRRRLRNVSPTGAMRKSPGNGRSPTRKGAGGSAASPLPPHLRSCESWRPFLPASGSFQIRTSAPRRKWNPGDGNPLRSS
jgi:hypothetical protein